jgi:hypothetical protein
MPEFRAGHTSESSSKGDVVQSLFSIHRQSLVVPSEEEEEDEIPPIDSELHGRDLLKGLTDLREKLNLAVSRKLSGDRCTDLSDHTPREESKSPLERRAMGRQLSFNAVSSRITLQTESENEGQPMTDVRDSIVPSPAVTIGSPVSDNNTGLINPSWKKESRKQQTKCPENIEPVVAEEHRPPSLLDRKRFENHEAPSNVRLVRELHPPSSPTTDITQLSASQDSKISKSGPESIVGPMSPKVHTTMSPYELRQIALLRGKQSPQNTMTEYSLAATFGKDSEGSAATLPRRRSLLFLASPLNNRKDNDGRSPVAKPFHDEPSKHHPPELGSKGRDESQHGESSDSAADEEAGDEIKSLKLNSHLPEPDAEPRALLWRKNPARNKHAKAQTSPGGTELPVCPPFKEPRRRTFFGLPIQTQNVVREGEMANNLKKNRKLSHDPNSTERNNEDTSSPFDAVREDKVEAVSPGSAFGSSNGKESSLTGTEKGSSKSSQHIAFLGHDEGLSNLPVKIKGELSLNHPEPNHSSLYVADIGSPPLFKDNPAPKETRHVRLQHTASPTSPTNKLDNFHGILTRSIDGAQPALEVCSGDRDAELTKPSSAPSDLQRPVYTKLDSCNLRSRHIQNTSSGMYLEEIAPVWPDLISDAASEVPFTNVEHISDSNPIRSKSSGNVRNYGERAWSWESHCAPNTSENSSQTSPLSPEVQTDPPFAVLRRRTFFVPSIPSYTQKVGPEAGYTEKSTSPAPTGKSVRKGAMRGFMTFSRANNSLKAPSARGSYASRVILNQKAHIPNSSSHNEITTTSQHVPDKRETKLRGSLDVTFPSHAQSSEADPSQTHEPKNVKKSIRHRFARKRIPHQPAPFGKNNQPRASDAHVPRKTDAEGLSSSDSNRKPVFAQPTPNRDVGISPLRTLSDLGTPRSAAILTESAPRNFSDERTAEPPCPSSSPSGPASTACDPLNSRNNSSNLKRVDVEARSRMSA